jgi:transposase InsO family protein
MIGLEDRQTMVLHIETAHRAGARLRPACEVAGISMRTFERWQANDGLIVGDRRPGATRPTPAHALTGEERARILAVANTPRFAEQPPARIVPTLADEGVYIASESSFQRVLRAHGQNAHRGRSRAPRPHRAPTTHVATAPGQLWCWDMTYLPTPVQGQWFYLYLILDLYSRMIVGWAIHASDDSAHAVHLLKRTALTEGVHAMPDKPVLHGDNGSTLKATTVLAMLHWLGVKPSYSRPRVSDDNAFVESLFKTAKYRPEFPVRGFADLETARAWGHDFVRWYNFEHRHSGIRHVTPASRHTGKDTAILAARHRVYLQARADNPARWSSNTRNWAPIGAVTLNPERDSVIRDLRAENKTLSFAQIRRQLS